MVGVLDKGSQANEREEGSKLSASYIYLTTINISISSAQLSDKLGFAC